MNATPPSMPLQTKDLPTVEHTVSSDALLRLAGRPIFRWNDLPGELKNRIYEACLTTSGTISIDSYYKNGKKPPVRDDSKIDKHRLCRENHRTDATSRRELVPNLLRINKQTYREGAPLLYNNHLQFLGPHAFGDFMLQNEDNKWLESIEHVTVCKWTNTRKVAWHILATKVTNLQTLTLGELNYFPLIPLAAFIFVTEYARMWFDGVGTNKTERCAAIDRMIRLPFENTTRHYARPRTQDKAEGLMELHLSMEDRFRSELKRSM